MPPICHHYGNVARFFVTNLEYGQRSNLVTDKSMTGDQQKWPNGLARLVEAMGVNQSELARAIGTNRQNVSRWVSQTRKIPDDYIQKIADYLSVTRQQVAWEDAGGVVTAPLISWVSASTLQDVRQVDRLTSEDFEVVTAPGLSANGKWVALRVEGDSMDRISPPDSIIFVNLKERDLVPNACYVIADQYGAATYKRFRPSPDRFEPVSVNDRHQPIFIGEGYSPIVLGRVRKSLLDM